MGYKIYFVLLSFLLANYAQKKNQLLIKCGKYTAACKDTVYIINIKSDSTFQYTMQLGKPIAYTYGKWRINKSHLILQSVADTLKFRSSHYSGKYVFFDNEKYTATQDALTEKNSPQKKYVLSEVNH